MRRNRIFIFFTLAFFFFNTFSFAQNIKFSGQIKEETTQKGLKDIHIFIPNSTFQTFSDSSGRFAMANIPAGRWEIVLIGEGFETVTKTIEIEKNKTNSQNFLLKPIPRSFSLTLTLSEKKREKLKEKFIDSFLSESDYSSNIRLLNPEALQFSEKENSKDIQVEAEGYLIFVNDKTGFLYTLYLLEPYVIDSSIEGKEFLWASLDLINEVPELISERTKERENIFINSPEFTLRQILTGEIASASGKPINVAFGTFPGEYILSFPKPYDIEEKGSISYTGDQLELRSEGFAVFENQLILEGKFADIHPLDRLPRNFNGEKILRLANIKKNAQVMQEKVFLQTDRKHYLKGETLFFKANMIYANPLLAQELSKVLHVEIIDDSGYRQYHQVFEIKAGKSFGSITLPVDQNQENYFLRAYTSWSLNYGDEGGNFVPFQVHDPSLKPSSPLPSLSSKGVVIFSEKQHYSPNETVNLNIMVRDDNGKPLAADLAISVLDMGQTVPIPSNETINTLFELKPIDPTTDINDFKYPIENGFSISGEIKNNQNNTTDGNVTALVNGLENMEKYKVFKDGKFIIPNLRLEGDIEIAIQAESRDGLPIRNISLEIQDFQTNKTPPSIEFPALVKTKISPLTVEEIRANMQEGELLLDEFVLDEEKKDPVGPMIYGFPDNSVETEDLPLNGSTSQFLYLLAGQVPGMNVSGNPPSVRFRNGGEPLVMIDGVPINPPSGSIIGGGSPGGRTATEVIAGINVFAIDRVEVIKRTVSMLGEGGRNGIISIFMKSGADLQKANEAMMNNFTPFKLTGYPVQKSFSEIIEEQNLNPLLRGLKPTLYWNPELITNTEELSQKVQFKSPESGGQMWVEIKGITADGKPIIGKFVLNQQ